MPTGTAMQGRPLRRLSGFLAREHRRRGDRHARPPARDHRHRGLPRRQDTYLESR
ncbi:MAG: hypothetical protein ACLT1W_11870 [Alistipes onderdonkii]